MAVHIINPLSDPRWNDLVEQHPCASAFHCRGWLEALARTYGYEPIAITTSSPGEPLKNAMVFCRVDSWLTGRRLVSLPFSDHCDPLADGEDFHTLIRWLEGECDRKKYRYVELRPYAEQEENAWPSTQSFWFHELDLRPNLDELFAGLQKDSIQRKIRRASKESLVYDVGRSPDYVKEFYQLLLKTRRRHHLFPQPAAWFQNVLECMGEKAEIRLARKDGVAVASMFTLRHGNTIIYKYGCSDEERHQLGGMPLLFWKLIEEGKNTGATVLDLGRSDLEQQGLIVFKDRFGARKRRLTYSRFQNSSTAGKANLLKIGWAQRLFPVLPNKALSLGGRLLYRHMG